MTERHTPNERGREDREPEPEQTADAGAPAGVLGGVGRTETIADCADTERVGRELPPGWEVRPDVVQWGEDPLAETLLFERTVADPKLVLRPADPDRPAEDIELYERSGPRSAPRRTMTVDRLPEVLRVAVNRVHQFEG
jgi:hypothetical protein